MLNIPKNPYMPVIFKKDISLLNADDYWEQWLIGNYMFNQAKEFKPRDQAIREQAEHFRNKLKKKYPLMTYDLAKIKHFIIKTLDNRHNHTYPDMVIKS
jgi:hypothetical protein